MTRKKLPIGIQTFKKIRDVEESFIYVDKTEIAFELLNGAGYYFLSRPRRFGKSLFLDTLSEIFKGHKAYFEGLYIYDKWNWEETFPVVKISFTGTGYGGEEKINKIIHKILDHNCRILGIDREECYNSEPDIYFQKLIYSVYKKYNQKVVILIDEYDKPILDNIGKEDKSILHSARDIKGFLFCD